MTRRRFYGSDNRWVATGEALTEGGQAHLHVVIDSSGSRTGEYVIKLLKNAKRTPRLDNEIQTTCRLFSIGCPVLEIVDDYLRSDTGAERPWYVSPRIARGPLSQHLTPGIPYGGSFESALRLFQRILDGVLSLHAADVAHRDLKPDNILLEEEQVVLGDLGLALAVGETEGDRLTAELERIGSLHYTPPEAFSRRPIDQKQFAFDAFALGKILYEVLAGVTLPAFVAPQDPEYDLTAKRNSAGYRAVNRVLRGLLHEDPSVRLVYLKELRSQTDEILTLEDSSAPSSPPVARWHTDLLSASDLLATRPGPVKAKKPEEVMKDETDQIAREVLDVWQSSEAVTRLEDALGLARGGHLSVSLPAQTDVARSQLGGLQPTRKGLEPLEDAGYPFRPSAESGVHLTVASTYPDQVPFRQLWLFVLVGAKAGQTAVAAGIMRRELGERGTTDVIHNRINVITAKIGDPALVARTRSEAEKVLDHFVHDVIAEVRTITLK